MINKIFIATIIFSVTAQIQCSLQDKITQSSDKISHLRCNIKNGSYVQSPETNVADTCGSSGGVQCCGNSCSRD